MNGEKMKKNYELCIRDESNLIVAWQAGMSEEDIENILKRHAGWKRSFVFMEN